MTDEVEGRLGIAVIGVNNQGRDHIEAIGRSVDFRLAALCDRDEGLLKTTLDDFGLGSDVGLYREMRDVFADPQVDAAIVALPHHLHLEAVELAAEFGKHLLKEKPLARSLEEAHRFIGIARAGHIQMHTGVQRRHHATYGFLKETLAGKSVRSVSLEMLVQVRARADAVPVKTWRQDMDMAGGGVLIDLGYHGVDLLHYLFGPLQLLSCLTLVDGQPCPWNVTESDARVWAMAGKTWIRMQFGRASYKRELLVVECEDGVVFEADRSHVWEVNPAGDRRELFASERDWSRTLVDQLTTFARSIREGQASHNDLPEQTPTQRFIERCYAHRRSEGIQEVVR